MLWVIPLYLAQGIVHDPFYIVDLGRPAKHLISYWPISVDQMTILDIYYFHSQSHITVSSLLYT